MVECARFCCCFEILRFSSTDLQSLSVFSFYSSLPSCQIERQGVRYLSVEFPGLRSKNF
jgi:hypothetical protein